MKTSQDTETSMFTPTEAAVLTRLSVKAVNNAIDKKIVPAGQGRRAGYSTRLLDLRALMSLTLERRLAERFLPALRREVFDALPGASRRAVSLDGGFLKIDLREPRRELAQSLRSLRRARQTIVSDPEIMGGDPVFRGTRLPVHLIADLLEQGESEADLREGYPQLTPEMVRLAPIYAGAYPLRGRPRSRPWEDQVPLGTTRRRMVSTGVA